MTLAEVHLISGGELHGPADLEVGGPVGLEEDSPGGIAFAENATYLLRAEASQAAALLLPKGLASQVKPYISVDSPRVAFFKLSEAAQLPLPLNPGVHPTAVVDPMAKVDSSAQIGAYAVVERRATIGAGARIYAFAYVGEACEVGMDCVVYPHAVLYSQVRLGARSIVHAGAVLGADGFGYANVNGSRVKVPQIGKVEVGEDCEIGALTTIDRATLGSTKIGRGTKLDNLVQVAHNVSMGEDCAIAAQSGIAGSASLGDRVLVAGQSGVADHVSIASDVVLEARSAALQHLSEPGNYIGVPAKPGSEAKRALLLVSKLPELLSRLRIVEKRLNEK